MLLGLSCRQQYLSSCAVRFVLSLENDLTVRAKTTEINVKDFCSGSYATIFREEVHVHVSYFNLPEFIDIFLNAIP